MSGRYYFQLPSWCLHLDISQTNLNSIHSRLNSCSSPLDLIFLQGSPSHARTSSSSPPTSSQVLSVVYPEYYVSWFYFLWSNCHTSTSQTFIQQLLTGCLLHSRNCSRYRDTTQTALSSWSFHSNGTSALNHLSPGLLCHLTNVRSPYYSPYSSLDKLFKRQIWHLFQLKIPQWFLITLRVRSKVLNIANMALPLVLKLLFNPSHQ